MIDQTLPEPVLGDGVAGQGRRASRRDLLGGGVRLAAGAALALAVVGPGFAHSAVAQEDDDEAADDADAAAAGGEDESAEDVGVGGGGRSRARGGQGGGGQVAARAVTAMPSTGTGAAGDPGSTLGLLAFLGAGAAAVSAYARRPGLRPE